MCKNDVQAKKIIKKGFQASFRVELKMFKGHIYYLNKEIDRNEAI